MGVQYDAYVAWGLIIPGDRITDGNDPEDVFEFPDGFSYLFGGNHFDGEGDYVLLPHNARKVVLRAGGFEDGFGVHQINHIYAPNDDELHTLVDFAVDNGIPARIGWFAVSNVG